MVKAMKLPVFFYILLFIAELFAIEQNYYRIDESLGRVVVKRAKKHLWAPIGKNGKIYNNDIIKTEAGSWVQLTDTLQNQIIIGESSSIHLSLIPISTQHYYSCFSIYHGTIFANAISSPLASPIKSTMKIYTPISVHTLKNSSSIIHFKNDTTLATTLRGNVTSTNIMTRERKIVSTGLKTLIIRNVPHISIEGVLTTDVQKVQRNIPNRYLIKEMNEQKAIAQKSYDILQGNLQPHIVILPCENRSKYRGNLDITYGVSKYLENLFLQKGIRAYATDYELEITESGVLYDSKYAIELHLNTFIQQNISRLSQDQELFYDYHETVLSISYTLYDTVKKQILIKKTITDNFSIPFSSINEKKLVEKSIFDPEYGTLARTSTGKGFEQILKKVAQSVNTYLLDRK